MGKGETSRKRILMEAFKLFATMPYERVSFSVMEKEIGISRGSMIYYFKNLSLCSFYTYFIETLKREQEQLSNLGIVNINEALMRIENSALTYIPNFKEQTAQWYEEELQIWKSVIEYAVSSGEISNRVDPVTISYFYEDCYLGRAFNGVFMKTGYDIDKLKQTYDQLYALLNHPKSHLPKSSE